MSDQPIPVLASFVPNYAQEATCFACGAEFHWPLTTQKVVLHFYDLEAYSQASKMLEPYVHHMRLEETRKVIELDPCLEHQETARQLVSTLNDSGQLSKEILKTHFSAESISG